jgi:hypothetical protein
MTPQQALERAEEIGAEPCYRNQLARQVYQAGRRDAEADMARRWAQAAGQVTRGVFHAGLEERRWGPGGRARFADPRPGHFPGRGARPQARPATEREETG